MATKTRGRPKKDEPILPDAKIEKYTSSQRCILTSEEIADRADRAAAMLADRDQKEEEQKAAAKHAKSIIEAIDADLRHVSNEVRTRSTYRAIECERRFEYTTGIMREIRLDTDEVIGERKLTLAEMQRELPFEDANGTGE